MLESDGNRAFENICKIMSRIDNRIKLYLDFGIDSLNKIDLTIAI